MIVYYDNHFTHEDLIKKEIKNERYKVFNHGDFKAYVDQIKDERDEEVKIIYNTKLHRINPDKMEEDRDYLFIGKYCFELKAAKDKRAKYFIPVSDTEFILVENFNFLPIILLLIALLLIGGSVCALRIKAPTPDPIAMDDSQQEGEGEQVRTPDSEFYQESTVIPGYAEIKATSTSALIPLSNPEENTVNFVYTILKEGDEEVVKTFTDESEANTYVLENTVEYTNFKDGNSYKLKDADGNVTDKFVQYRVQQEGSQYKVVKDTYDMVYFSEGIAPGKHIDWNCYEYLGKGDFNTQFRISTYDVETSEQCYGAVQSVHIMIK